jgi:hypothetical protein
MKKLTFLFPVVCLAPLVFSSAVAHADNMNLAPYVGQTVSVTIEPYASGENNGSFYVGLTDVNVATTGGTAIASVEAYCDDFTHEIPVPDTYNAVVTAVQGNTTLEQEAYYGMMFGSTPSGNAALDSDIQELIWNFTAPSNQQFALNSEMQTLQTEMLNNYATANYSSDVYLNAGNNGQSFMSLDPAPTPEPPTLLTLATGLIGLAFFFRRRSIQC